MRGPVSSKRKVTLYLIETSFNFFATRADPDQVAVVRAAWSGSILFTYGTMIYLIIQCTSGTDK